MTKTVIAAMCVVVTCATTVGCGGEDSGGYDEPGTSDGAGGGAGDAQALNGCDVATAEDHTGEGAVVIVTDGLSYSPACVRISVGTKVTIDSNFASHPLKAGIAATGAVQEGSPIVPTDAGTSVEIDFASASLAGGAFGFYCQVHAPSMAGAVFVE
jgi:plastocyanin